MQRVSDKVILPTIKTPEEVIHILKNRMGWFVVYKKMWVSPNVGAQSVRFRRKLPVDARTNLAFKILSVHPGRVVATINQVMEEIDDPDAIVEFRAETPNALIDDEMMGRIYGFEIDRGRDL